MAKGRTIRSELSLMGHYLLEDGSVLYNVHGVDNCSGTPCSIHMPSEHPLADEPRAYDSKARIVLRICEHGVHHPDFDALTYLLASTGRVDYRHLCCVSGCCGIPKHVYIDERRTL